MPVIEFTEVLLRESFIFHAGLHTKVSDCEQEATVSYPGFTHHLASHDQ